MPPCQKDAKRLKFCWLKFYWECNKNQLNAPYQQSILHNSIRGKLGACSEFILHPPEYEKSKNLAGGVSPPFVKDEIFSWYIKFSSTFRNFSPILGSCKPNEKVSKANLEICKLLSHKHEHKKNLYDKNNSYFFNMQKLRYCFSEIWEVSHINFDFFFHMTLSPTHFNPTLNLGILFLTLTFKPI